MKGNLSASKDGNTKAKVLSVFDELGSWMHLILAQLSNKNMQVGWPVANSLFGAYSIKNSIISSLTRMVSVAKF